MGAVLEKFLEVAKHLDHDFVYGYIQMIDGERDPRNLLLIFSVLTPGIVSQIAGHARFVEELFDVTSCYFPINFTPRPNDTLTTAMLQDGLDGAMVCTPAFAQFCVPFLLEKIEAAPSAYVWRSFIRAIDKFGATSLTKEPLLALWNLISQNSQAPDATTISDAMHALHELVALLSRDYVSSSSANTRPQPLDELLNLLSRDCLHNLKVSSAESKVFKEARHMLCTGATASAEASRILGKVFVPFFVETVEQVDRRHRDNDQHSSHGHSHDHGSGSCSSQHGGGGDEVSTLLTELATFTASLREDVVAHHATALFPLGIAKKCAPILVTLVCTPKALQDADTEKALHVLLAAQDAVANLTQVASRRPELVCKVVVPLIAARQQPCDDVMLPVLEAVSQQSVQIFQCAYDLVLQHHLTALPTVVPAIHRCLKRLVHGKTEESLVVSSMIARLLAYPGVPLEMLALASAIMDEERQNLHKDSFVRLAQSVDDEHSLLAGCAALSALRPAITLAAVDELVLRWLAVPLASVSEQFALWVGSCVGNMVNKGTLTMDTNRAVVAILTEALCSHPRGASILGWVCRGFLLGGISMDAFNKCIAKLIQGIESIDDPTLRSASSVALSSTLSCKDFFLSPGSSNAILKPFVRQRAFAQLLPKVATSLDALCRVASEMPSPILLGELDVLLPLLVRSVSASDPSTVLLALQCLSNILSDAKDAIQKHSDTLLPRVAQYCVIASDHHPVDLRLAALGFLSKCASTLPFARIFPVRERIVESLRVALDDPRRDVRMLAVTVCNIYHNLA